MANIILPSSLVVHIGYARWRISGSIVLKTGRHFDRKFTSTHARYVLELGVEMLVWTYSTTWYTCVMIWFTLCYVHTVSFCLLFLQCVSPRFRSILPLANRSSQHCFFRPALRMRNAKRKEKDGCLRAGIGQSCYRTGFRTNRLPGSQARHLCLLRSGTPAWDSGCYHLCSVGVWHIHSLFWFAPMNHETVKWIKWYRGNDGGRSITQEIHQCKVLAALYFLVAAFYQESLS